MKKKKSKVANKTKEERRRVEARKASGVAKVESKKTNEDQFWLPIEKIKKDVWFNVIYVFAAFLFLLILQRVV